MAFRFLLLAAFFSASIASCKLEADESVVQFMRSFAESVEAAKNKFQTVEVKGVSISETKVLEGKPGHPSRSGEPYNSFVKCSLHYLHKDFGLTQRIISIPEPGASPPDYWTATRDVLTPNYDLDVFDQKGYVRPASNGLGSCEDFLACFWIPNQSVQEMVPPPSLDHARFSLQSNEDGSGTFQVAFKPFSLNLTLTLAIGKFGNKLLPTRYDLTRGDELITQHTWVWETLPSGNYYPRKFSSQSRTIYPAPNYAVQLDRMEVEFTEVTEGLVVSDESFTFSALGLEPGAIVYDVRDATEARFEFQPDSSNLLGLVEKPLPAEYRTIEPGLPRPFRWLRTALLAVVFVLALGVSGYFLRFKVN